jgi:hypothetical protein
MFKSQKEQTQQTLSKPTGGAAPTKEIKMNKQQYIDKTIVHMGEVWKVIGVGAQTEQNTFCHLLNLHRGRKQKNGFVGAQINDWVDTAVLNAAK